MKAVAKCGWDVILRPLVVISIPFVFSACAGSTNLKSDQIYSPKSRSREAYTASGSISWKSPKQNIAAALILAVESSGNVRMEVLDPLGSRLALLILTKDQFWWESNDSELAYTGPIKSKNLSQLIPIPFQQLPMSAILLAQPPTNAKLSRSQRTGEVEKWQIDSNWEAEYPDFGSEKGKQYPAEIRLRSLGQGITVVWRLESWSEFQKGTNPHFTLPPPGSIATRYRRLP